MVRLFYFVIPIGAVATSTQLANAGELYRSTRSASMGDAVMSRMPVDEAIWLNPASAGFSSEAKVSILSPTVDYNSGGKKLINLISEKEESEQIKILQDLSGEPSHIGLYGNSGYFSRYLSIGLLSSIDGDAYFAKDARYSGLEKLNAKIHQNLGLLVSTSQVIMDNFYWGATLKAINRKQSTLDFAVSEIDRLENFELEGYTNSGNGVGLDAGLSYRQTNIEWQPEYSIVITDIGDTSFKQQKDNPPVDQIYQNIAIGTSLVQPSFHDAIAITYHIKVDDLASRRATHFSRKLNLGLDTKLFDMTGVRMGVNDGYLSGGTYFESSWFQCEVGSYAFEHSDTIGERIDRRYFAKLGFTF